MNERSRLTSLSSPACEVSAQRWVRVPVAAAPEMTAALDPRDEHAAILRDILRVYLSQYARAYVFGSRAHGGASRYSDLDLALEWDRPLGLDVVGQIAEALSQSDLPFKVDIVDLALVEPAFRARVLADCIALPPPPRDA